MDYEFKIQEAAKFVRESNYLVAFTGAGISTESGLSDFRSPGGLWQRFRIVTYQEFLSSEEARKDFWKMRKELIDQLLVAKPNEAHLALVKLEEMGKLKWVITQNIDGLHQMAGNKNVIELHGNNRSASCLRCGKLYTIEEVKEMLGYEALDISCLDCGGIVKPRIVMFGEAMPREELALAFDVARKADVMFVIGTSLQVEPAASVPRVSYDKGAKLIFINNTSTPWDHIATLLFHDRASKVLGDILARL